MMDRLVLPDRDDSDEDDVDWEGDEEVRRRNPGLLSSFDLGEFNNCGVSSSSFSTARSGWEGSNNDRYRVGVGGSVNNVDALSRF